MRFRWIQITFSVRVALCFSFLFILLHLHGSFTSLFYGVLFYEFCLSRFLVSFFFFLNVKRKKFYFIDLELVCDLAPNLRSDSSMLSNGEKVLTVLCLKD